MAGSRPMIRKLSIALTLLALVIPAGAAGYKIEDSISSGGGRVFTYHNAAPEHRWAVEQGVRAWNRSGADVRFRPAPRGEAELVIEAETTGLKGHARSTRRGDGEPRPGDSKISLPVSAGDPREQRFSVALIATHELGHVLGLNHEDGGCATMNSTITNSAPARCRQPPAGHWRCGLLEEDDIRGAVAIYGGRPRPPRRATCPEDAPDPKPDRAPAPPPPDPLSPAAAVEVTSDPGRSSQVNVRWRNGQSDRIRSVVVARARGRCPARPGGLERESVAATPGQEGRATFPLELESACYAVWSRDRRGTLSREPATAWLDGPASPGPPRGFEATLGLDHPLGGTDIALRWHNSDAATLRKVVIARARDRCPSRPPRDAPPWDSPRATPDGFQKIHDLRFYPGADARRYCYAIWSRDRFGRLSRPVTAWPRAVDPEEAVIVLAG